MEGGGWMESVKDRKGDMMGSKAMVNKQNL